MTTKNKIVLKVTVFLSILTIIYNILFEFCIIRIPSNNTVRNRWFSLYNLPKGKLDIICLGNSHAGASLDSGLLTEYLGMRSFTLASPGQNLIETHFVLKEVYKYHSPKVVIVELFSVASDNRKKETPLRNYHNVDGMKLSLNKINMVYHTFDKMDYIYALLPMIREHNIWKSTQELSDSISLKTEYNPNYFGHLKIKNTLTLERAKSYKEYNCPKEKRVLEFNSWQKKWVEKTIRLAQGKKSKIVFVMAPFYKEYKKKTNYDEFYKELKTYFNKREIPYLDYNIPYKIGRFAREDYANDELSHNQHLNAIGSNKMAGYLIKELLRINGLIPEENKRRANKKLELYNLIIEYGEEGNSVNYMGTGWGFGKKDYTFTNEETAKIRIPVRKQRSDISLTADIEPYLWKRKVTKQRVFIEINNKMIGQWTVVKPGKYKIEIPKKYLNSNILDIKFRLPDAKSPKELKINNDERKLGVKFYNLSLSKGK